jgi:hypothetical protein
VEIAAHRRTAVIAVALEDLSAHGDDPQLGVDDQDAGLGHQREDRLGELRCVAEPIEVVEAVREHQESPIQ